MSDGCKHTQNRVIAIMGCLSVQYGSFEDNLVALATECSKRQIELTLVYPSKPGNDLFVRDIKNAGAELLVLPETEKADFKCWMGLNGLFKKVKPTVVHSHFGRVAYLSIHSAFRNAVPHLLITKHHISGADASIRHRMVFHWLTAKIERIFCVSKEVVKDLRKIGLPGEKLIYAPHGIKLSRFSLHKDGKGDLTNELGMDPKELIVAAISHLNPGKGLDSLLKSVPLVLKVFPNTTFLLAGEGPLLPDLKQLTEELAIATKVRFLGLRQDVPSLLAGCDVFVNTSLSEGGGLSTLEAMAAGKPVITTLVGLMKDFVREEDNGLIVPKANPASTAATINRLLGDPLLRRRIGMRARRDVQEQYEISSRAKHMADFYNGGFNSPEREKVAQ